MERVDGPRGAASGWGHPSAVAATSQGAFGDRLSQRTPLDGASAYAHLWSAWEAVTGEAARPRTIALLWAQWALETGRGRHMYGHNFAGLKGRSPDGGSLRLATTEISGGQSVRMRCDFRAYATADEGARDFVRVLSEKFPGALEAARDGSPARYVGALAAGAYFTADQSDYARAVTTLAAEAERGPRTATGMVPAGALADGVLWSLSRAIRLPGARG